MAFPRYGQLTGSGGGAAPATDIYSTALTRGYNLCGLTPATSKAIIAHDGTNLSQMIVTTPATVPTTTAEGGFFRNGLYWLGTGADYPRLMRHAATTRFWAAAMFKVRAIGTSHLARFSMGDPATGAGCAVGYNYTMSTTKYAAYTYDGTNGADSALSTIDVDATWRKGEIWNDGAGYKFAISEEAAIPIVVVNQPTAYSTIGWQGAAGTGGQTDVSWMMCIVAGQ